MWIFVGSMTSLQTILCSPTYGRSMKPSNSGVSCSLPTSSMILNSMIFSWVLVSYNAQVAATSVWILNGISVLEIMPLNAG